jgi:hypothetical protein
MRLIKQSIARPENLKAGRQHKHTHIFILLVKMANAAICLIGSATMVSWDM